MDYPFASFFRTLLERFRPPRTVAAVSHRRGGSVGERSALPREPEGLPYPAVTDRREKISPDRFRKLLIEALDDPAFARALARRLQLPAFPIQGALCGGPAASEITAGSFGCGAYTFAANGAGVVPLSAKGFASQTADLQQWQDSAGTVLATVAASGKVGIGTASPSGALDIQKPVQAANYVYLYNNVGTNSPSMSAGLFFGWNKSNGEGESIIGYSSQLGGRPRLDFASWDGTTYTTLATLQGAYWGVGTNNPPSKLTLQLSADSEKGLRVTDGTAASNIVLQPLAGGNSGFQSLNFNGYYDAGEQRFNSAKNRWRLVVDQRSATDRFILDTWNGTALTNILAATTAGNVGIGTTSPDNKLHVMDGHIAIEAAAGQGKLKFRQSGTTRNEIYRNDDDFTILRNWNQDYTILKIWAPTGAVLNDREATLALVRGDNDEEFMDIYNNGYTSETQYGIRIAKNTGGQFRDFVFDQWDKTQTPNVKTPLMILKTDGKVGVGTDVPGARLEAADPTVLAGETLTNGALTSGTSWSRTGDMVLASNAATYTHSTGAGTLTQASGNFAIAAKPYRLYLFTYTISGVSGTPPSASITTAFAAASRPLKIKANGTYTDTVLIHAAASPGNFVIEVTSSAAGSFTIDNLSLKEVTGGDIIADGLFTGGGPSGIKVDNAGNVGIGESSPDYKLDVNGAFGFTPGSSVTPLDNGDVTFELTNNTTLTVKAKGSDGTVRSGTIALA